MTGGVRGHVRIWALEEEQLQAGMYVAVFVVFCLCYISFLPTAHNTPFLSCWFMQSEGAPADGRDVNHPSVSGRRPTPVWSGTRIKWDWADLSSPLRSSVISCRPSSELKRLTCTVASLYRANKSVCGCCIFLKDYNNCVTFLCHFKK